MPLNNGVLFLCSHNSARSQRAEGWPGASERHIGPFEDPAAATGSDDDKLAAFRRVRDEIRSKLESWLARQEQLQAATEPSA